MEESKCEDSSYEVLAKLKRLPIFSSFEEKYIDGILKASKLRVYEPREMIIREGEIDNWIYVIIKGKVLVAKGGMELCLLSGECQVFGEMSIIEAKPRSASASALEKAECLAIDASYMDNIDEDEKDSFYVCSLPCFCRAFDGSSQNDDGRTCSFQKNVITSSGCVRLPINLLLNVWCDFNAK